MDSTQILRLDLSLRESAAWSMPLQYTDSDGTPYDLTGWGATMVFAYGAASAAVRTLTSAGGAIAFLDAAAGWLEPTVTPTDVAALGAGRRGVYYLDLVPPSGSPVRFAEGFFEVCR